MKNIILILITLFLFSCKNEQKQESKTIHPEVERSEQFCYLSNVHLNDNIAYATIDFIEYKKILDIDSSINHSQIIELPNGFCYFNKESKLENLQFNKDVKIVMQTFSFNNKGSFNFNQSVTLSELLQRIDTSKNNLFNLSPFRVVLENSKIISLSEIYIP